MTCCPLLVVPAIRDVILPAGLWATTVFAVDDLAAVVAALPGLPATRTMDRLMSRDSAKAADRARFALPRIDMLVPSIDEPVPPGPAGRRAPASHRRYPVTSRVSRGLEAGDGPVACGPHERTNMVAVSDPAPWRHVRRQLVGIGPHAGAHRVALRAGISVLGPLLLLWAIDRQEWS